MLRAGGYFAWAAQPVYKHEVAQQEAWIGACDWNWSKITLLTFFFSLIECNLVFVFCLNYKT